MLSTHSETPFSQSQTASQCPVTVRAAGRALSLFGPVGGAISRYLEAVGQARASGEVRLLAASWANTGPELASQGRAASTCDARSQAARANREVHLLAAHPQHAPGLRQLANSNREE